MSLRGAISAALLCLAGAATATHAADPAAGYVADPAASRVDFIGVQAGAEFKGTFHKFTASIDFAPDALGSSRFDVVIDLNSVDTLDKDRDNLFKRILP